MDKVFYVGQTKNLNRRFVDHKAMYGKDIEINKVDEIYGDGQSATKIENKWIKKYADLGCDLLNKSTNLPNLATKTNCIECGTEIYSLQGKREKKFCDSTCRSNFWKKQKRKLSKPDGGSDNNKPNKTEFTLDFCDKCTQMTNHKGTECQKCKIPPMPVKRKGEDSFEFAARKNEWKKKYNQ